MNYCKKCGTELEDIDSFCEKCGIKIKSKITSNVSMSTSNKHVLPAILSFFIPALGQFVKGQVNQIYDAYNAPEIEPKDK